MEWVIWWQRMKSKFNLSITRILLVGIISITVFYIIAVYSLSQRQAVHEIEELFDAQLAHSSNILFNLLGESVSTIDQSSNHLPITYHGLESALQNAGSQQGGEDSLNALFYQKKVAYQIFNTEGKLLIKSSSASDTPFAQRKIGFSRAEYKGEVWRIFTMYDQDWNFWLHVGESEYIRNDLAEDIAESTLLPSLLFLPVLLILMVVIIRISTQPLKKLAMQLSKRDPKNLSSINIQSLPKEIKPVVKALNHLFLRLQDAIRREQRLTADAAHELRTPLSVVMIHAQNALNANTEIDRNTALKELEQGIARISRLLEQLLTLSKINPEVIPVSDISITGLIQVVLAEMAPKIYEKEQEIEFKFDEEKTDLKILGSEFLLEILLRNLVDNASRYSPKRGLISVTLNKNQDSVELYIEDSGAGVYENDYHKLTERFYRQQQNQSSGAGLGLSLVKAIADFHSADIEFSKSQLSGLRVEIRFKEYAPLE